MGCKNLCTAAELHQQILLTVCCLMQDMTRAAVWQAIPLHPLLRGGRGSYELQEPMCGGRIASANPVDNVLLHVRYDENSCVASHTVPPYLMPSSGSYHLCTAANLYFVLPFVFFHRAVHAPSL
jgi:hypothetical protein